MWRKIDLEKLVECMSHFIYNFYFLKIETFEMVWVLYTIGKVREMEGKMDKIREKIVLVNCKTHFLI